VGVTLGAVLLLPTENALMGDFWVDRRSDLISLGSVKSGF